MSIIEFADLASDRHMKMRLILEGALVLLENETIGEAFSRTTLEAIAEALYSTRAMVIELQACAAKLQ